MIVRVLILSLWLLRALGGLAGAEESEVAPDRPDVTNGTRTVPPGSVQLESGLAYARARQAGGPPEQSLTVDPTLRIGLSDRLEARLEGQTILQLGGGDTSAHGGLDLGLKYRFFEAEAGGPSLGVEPFLRVPFAPRGSGRPDLGLLALASADLPWELSLDVNAGMAAVAQTRPEGYLLQALVSASLGKQLGERLSGFVELVFASRGERAGRDSLGFDTGVILLLTRSLALDAAVATSLRGPGPDYAVRAGVTVLFGK